MRPVAIGDRLCGDEAPVCSALDGHRTLEATLAVAHAAASQGPVSLAAR